jgi:hypothetical protein
MPLLSSTVKEAFEARKSASSGGNYLNPSSVSEGDKLRITFLGDDSLAGWQCWATSSDGKRIPLRFAAEPTPDDIKTRAAEEGATADPSECKAFYAFAVWNYDDERVQVFQFHQTGIAAPIIEALSDEEIEAEPGAYDFIIKASGSGMDKRYSVTPMPGKRRQPKIESQVDAAWQKVVEAGFDLKALLMGGDPFKPAF